MKYQFAFLLSFLFWMQLPAAAQPVRVSASVSQQKILIGEPFQLTYRVQMKEGQAVEWFVSDSFPHFEILHRSAIDTVRSGGGEQILVQNLRLTSWDSGRWNLPAFALARSNRTSPIPITVSFAPMDPAQPYHGVKEVMDVERPGYQNWWWYLIGLALLLFFLLLLFPGKKKKEKAMDMAPEGAYREAMKQLDQLDKKRNELPVKEFYTQLIEVLRTYLMHRKDYTSPSKTTTDIQQQLPAWGLQGTVGTRLLDTLQLSDGVKFARFEASVEDRKTSVEQVRDAIAQMERKESKGSG